MPDAPLTAPERDRLARLFANIASEAGVAVMEVYASDFTARTKADSSRNSLTLAMVISS